MFYLSVLYVFLNGWADFDEIVCVCLSGTRDDLYSQLDPIGQIGGGAQTGISGESADQVQECIKYNFRTLSAIRRNRIAYQSD